MRRIRRDSGRHGGLAGWMTVCSALLVIPMMVASATGGPARPERPDDKGTAEETALQMKLQAMRAKVAELEAALRRKQRGGEQNAPDDVPRDGEMKSARKKKMGMAGGNKPDMAKMGGGKKKAGRPISGKSMPGMSGMAGKNGSGMGRMPGRGKRLMSDMGRQGRSAAMGMMGRRPGASGMTVPSTLPGFPGASHIYHIGQTGFFLDHPQHITLTAEQQTALNQIKEKALLADSSAERQIDEAEQRLWSPRAPALSHPGHRKPPISPITVA